MRRKGMDSNCATRGVVVICVCFGTLRYVPSRQRTFVFIDYHLLYFGIERVFLFTECGIIFPISLSLSFFFVVLCMITVLHTEIMSI